jgi:opacity protein-like surface antigen
VRGGLLYHTLDLDVDGTVADEIICDGDCDSDASLGFEVGGGLDFPLGRKVSVTPAVRYTSYEADFGDADDDPTISSVVLDVGLRIRL